MQKSCISLGFLAGTALLLCVSGIAQFRISDSAQADLYPGVSTSTVWLDVRVTDKNGAPVSGLRAEDFEIYQDRRLQSVTGMKEIRSDKNSDEPRIIVFLIDDLGLAKEKFAQAKTALRYFADHIMQTNDMVGLARTAGGGFVFQPLTSDPDILKSGLERWQWSFAATQPLVNYQSVQIVGSPFIQSCSGST